MKNRFLYLVFILLIPFSSNAENLNSPLYKKISVNFKGELVRGLSVIAALSEIRTDWSNERWRFRDPIMVDLNYKETPTIEILKEIGDRNELLGKWAIIYVEDLNILTIEKMNKSDGDE